MKLTEAKLKALQEYSSQSSELFALMLEQEDTLLNKRKEGV